jgi:hypothetical protein
MATLNEIAYNIKNLAYGGNSPKEVNISIAQIKHWIHYHRAKLIADNIDKGIMSNHILWQELKLDIHNYNNPTVRLYDRLWDIYWSEFNKMGSPVSKPTPTNIASGIGQTPYDVEFLEKIPMTLEGDLNGYFITGPNTMTGMQSSSDILLGGENRNQYGLTTPSSQFEKGDFRNISSSEFIIPELLMLKNHGSIKDVSLRRRVYHTDIDSYGDMDRNIDNSKFGPHHDFIHLPIKTIDESSYSDFNRFSTSNKSHAILKRTTRTKKSAVFTGFIASNPEYSNDAYINDGFNDGNGYLDATIPSGTLVLKLNGLQVSPNYYSNNENENKYQILWAYDGNLRAILANPTEATTFRRFDITTMTNNTPHIYLEELNRENNYYGNEFAHWSDDKTPYPIPTEYIKDLIDRVIATEVSISTKLPSDEIRDNVDTTKIMQYGAKVQE